MLLEGSIHVAIYCGACGKYESHEISLFKLKKGEEIKLESECSDEYITIKTDDFKKFYFSIYCHGCKARHTYSYSLTKIINNDLKIFKCHLSRMDILLVGEKHTIEEIINSSNNEIDDIIDKCGFDKQIENPYIMIKILDKIHEIAEHNNLFCECGCKKIDVALFGDRIELRCERCNSLNVVYAETNQDLKNIAVRSMIMLHEKSFTCLDSMYF